MMSPDKFLSTTKHFLIKHKIILFVSFLYFLFRLSNLTLLPIFNDEAIYLDWGWRMTHGYIVWDYSLGDAKPELLMWIFGFFEGIFADPLFAGRLVSAIAGFLTLFGIYRIGQKFFTPKVAILASALYVFIPIFSFYDRQALMEASIAAVGIWSTYYSLLLFTNPRLRNALMLGIILGNGVFIKPNATIFLVSYLLIACIIFLKSPKRITILRNSVYMLCVFFATDILLFTDKEFWHTLSTNSRYSLTPKELIMFPIGQWVTNILANLEISFYFLTPLVLLASIAGCILYLRRTKDVKSKVLIFFLLIPIVLETFATRTPSQRYLVSYLPLFCVFSAYFVASLFSAKKRHFELVGSIALLSLPVVITVIQVLSPLSYFSLMDKISRFADKSEYVSGMTAGYGIDGITARLTSFVPGRNIIVGTGLNTGNPESALRVWAIKNPTIQVAYLDASQLGSSLHGIDCLNTFPPGMPVYFVSRNNQLVGLDKYMRKITNINNPYGTNHLGIYKLNDACKGTSLPIDFQTGTGRAVQLSQMQSQPNLQQGQQPTVQVQPSQGLKTFKNPTMNLQFTYPKSLIATQESSMLVSLADPSHADIKEKLLIFSTQNASANGTLSQSSLPFPAPGKLISSQPQTLNGFQGTMEVYSDNIDLTQILFIAENRQTFVIRFPEHKALDPSVVNEVLNSLNTTH